MGWEAGVLLVCVRGVELSQRASAHAERTRQAVHDDLAQLLLETRGVCEKLAVRPAPT